MMIRPHNLFWAMALVSVLGAPGVYADTIVERVWGSGSFLTSRMDANADGTASSWCTVEIGGPRRRSESMQQCVNEDVFTGFTAECPGGLFEVDAAAGIGTGVGVRTFRHSGDQLFIQLTDRYLCSDALGRITEGEDAGVIVGGTGRFEGATGSYQLHYTGQILYADQLAMPPQIFGALNAQGEWRINLAD